MIITIDVPHIFVVGYWVGLWTLMGLSLTLHLVKHGEKKDDKYNFWGSLFGLGVFVPGLLSGMGWI